MSDGDCDVLRVGVLVDLEMRETAGGHVKCWERIAEAATRLDLPLHLTIHAQGDAARSIDLSPRVRYVINRPLLGTARWRSLEVGADHTDLAPFHPGLLRQLSAYDVIHTTDAYFAYSRTAEIARRLWNKPLVTSVHTDTPSYTKIYAERILRRLCPSSALASWLIEHRKLPAKLAQGMERKLRRHIARTDWTLLGQQTGDGMPFHRASILRRGIDRACFTPSRRDRDKLCRDLGLSTAAKFILFVGRLDEGKGVNLLTSALKRLVEAGEDVVGLFAGRGPEAAWIDRQLGARARLLGQVERDRLAHIYASSDLFVLPSEIEISPNVVLEAKASGLVPVVAPNGGGRFVTKDGEDGIVVTEHLPEAWADAISAILSADAQRAAMAASAVRDIERNHPTWEQVILEDLYPIWLRAAAAKHDSSDKYVQTTPAYSRSAS